MQQEASYAGTNAYFNPIENEGAYNYIDVDVVPNESPQYEMLRDRPHEYEHLRHIPHGTGNTNPMSITNGRQQVSNHAQSAVPAADRSQNRNNHCMTPVCWRWAVLMTVLLIAAVVTAILVVNLTSNSNTANPPTTDDKTTPKTTLGVMTAVLSSMTVTDEGHLTMNTKQSTPSPTVPPETTSPATDTTTLRAKNCQEVYASGGQTSGVYSVYPDGQKEVRVYCEQVLRGGTWTVFQRRMDGSVDFYRNWADYKAGFGDPSGEYWVGNDNLHTLTADMDTQLLVELQHGGETQYAQYTEFWVLGEDQNYKLHVSGYIKGSACGDSLLSHNDEAFTTRDRDTALNCAKQRSGAWWYHGCTNSNLNGLYGNNSKKGITWFSWKGTHTSLSAVRMMLKTK